jgi:hypothetical protein
MSAAAGPAQAPRKWEGLVDEALEREVLGACLDQAPERRRVRELFKDVQLSIDHCLFKVNPPHASFAYMLRTTDNDGCPSFSGCSSH